MVEEISMVEEITKIFSNPVFFQIAFYVVSPIVAFLAFFTTYLAIYRQSKPSIVIYYELSEAGSVIDLVICNYGSGTARDISFSTPIPIHCWGIEAADRIDPEEFLNSKIPVLAPSKELRYQAGQYGGLFSQVGEVFTVTASYKFRTPLRSSKRGNDISILDLRYMKYMNTKNSAAYDLSDALIGRNNTIFAKINSTLTLINGQLSSIASNLEGNKDSE